MGEEIRKKHLSRDCDEAGDPMEPSGSHSSLLGFPLGLGFHLPLISAGGAAVF